MMIQRIQWREMPESTRIELNQIHTKYNVSYIDNDTEKSIVCYLCPTIEQAQEKYKELENKILVGN